MPNDFCVGGAACAALANPIAITATANVLNISIPFLSWVCVHARLMRYDSLSLYSNSGALLSVSRDVSTNAFQWSPSLFTTIVAGSTIT
jgi:hypothetical protein